MLNLVDLVGRNRTSSIEPWLNTENLNVSYGVGGPLRIKVCDDSCSLSWEDTARGAAVIFMLFFF